MWKQLANYGKNTYSRSSPRPARRSGERKMTPLGNSNIIQNEVKIKMNIIITLYISEIFTLLSDC